MGIFDQPGEFDESSFWYQLRSPELRALDMAIKARSEAAGRVVVMPAPRQPAAEPGLAERVTDVEGKLLALGLYTRTILQLLVDKSVITQDEFHARLRELDLLDGREDGR